MEFKNISKTEIEIIGEISASDFELHRKEAVKNLSNSVKIDGFRTGNIPEKVLIDKIGEQAVLEEMAQFALEKQYPKILKENNINAVGRPEISITKIAKDNPLGFKIKTSFIPEIEMPDYKKLAGDVMNKKEDIKVEDKEVNETIEQIIKSRAIKNEKGEDILPELTDEFAKTLGDFSSVDALKEKIKENLLVEKKSKARERKRIEALDKVISKSKIEVPKILIDAEKNKMLNEMQASISQMGLKWEDYLAHLKKTEEDILNGWDDDASKRIKYGLIINEIANKEKIEISDEEIEKEASKIVDYYKAMGQDIDKERAKDYTYGIVRNEKVFNILESC